MCSITSDDDLALLASGEMNRFRSREVRRHLSHCESCRAALAEIEQLRQTAADARSTHPSLFLQEKTWQEIRSVQPISSGSTVPRKRVRHTALSALTAGVVLAGLTYVAITPGTQPQTAGIAFAQVEAAMGSINTVTWRETFGEQLTLYPDGHYSTRALPGTYVLWARLQNPALVRLRGTQVRTVISPSEAYQIYSETAGLSYSLSYNGIQTPEVFGTGRAQTPRERLRSAIIFSRDIPDSEESTGKPDSLRVPGRIGRSPWVQNRATLEGKELLRFDRTVTFVPEPIRTSAMMQMDRQIWTFWVEPQTNRIVRREVVTRYASARSSVETKQISDRFRYNLTPPEGIFEITPPIGRRYSFVPLSQRRATGEEQRQIGVTIQNAINAWNRKDQAGFEAAWDFDYEVATKEHNDAHRRIVLRAAAKILNGKVSVKSVGSASSRISGVYTRRQASDPFPPKEPNEFLVSASVQTGNERKRLLLNMSRQSDGSFKIIRWNVARLNPHYRENA